VTVGSVSVATHADGGIDPSAVTLGAENQHTARIHVLQYTELMPQQPLTCKDSEVKEQL
jgi:hypothetical protein